MPGVWQSKNLCSTPYSTLSYLLYVPYTYYIGTVAGRKTKQLGKYNYESYPCMRRIILKNY